MTAFSNFSASYKIHQIIVGIRVNTTNSTEKLHSQFLQEAIERKPDELDNLADRQVSHGNLEEANVLTFLNWSKLLKASFTSTPSAAPAHFRFKAYTLEVVEAVLPGSRFCVLGNYACKSMHINDKDGKRFTDDEFDGHLPQ